MIAILLVVAIIAAAAGESGPASPGAEQAALRDEAATVSSTSADTAAGASPRVLESGGEAAGVPPRVHMNGGETAEPTSPPSQGRACEPRADLERMVFEEMAADSGGRCRPSGGRLPIHAERCRFFDDGVRYYVNRTGERTWLTPCVKVAGGSGARSGMDQSAAPMEDREG